MTAYVLENRHTRERKPETFTAASLAVLHALAFYPDDDLRFVPVVAPSVPRLEVVAHAAPR